MLIIVTTVSCFSCSSVLPELSETVYTVECANESINPCIYAIENKY